MDIFHIIIFIRTYLKIAALADTSLKMISKLIYWRVNSAFSIIFASILIYPVLCTRHSRHFEIGSRTSFKLQKNAVTTTKLFSRRFPLLILADSREYHVHQCVIYNNISQGGSNAGGHCIRHRMPENVTHHEDMGNLQRQHQQDGKEFIYWRMSLFYITTHERRVGKIHPPSAREGGCESARRALQYPVQEQIIVRAIAVNAVAITGGISQIKSFAAFAVMMMACRFAQ
jgi:hypothetical protein